MKKQYRFIAVAGVALLALCALLAAAVAWDGENSAGDPSLNAINQTLIGTNITYYGIAGKPMNFTIGPGDIQSIEKIEYKNDSAWQVRVGQGLSWDLILDADGKQILETKQLFVT